MAPAPPPPQAAGADGRRGSRRAFAFAAPLFVDAGLAAAAQRPARLHGARAAHARGPSAAWRRTGEAVRRMHERPGRRRPTGGRRIEQRASAKVGGQWHVRRSRDLRGTRAVHGHSAIPAAEWRRSAVGARRCAGRRGAADGGSVAAFALAGGVASWSPAQVLDGLRVQRPAGQGQRAVSVWFAERPRTGGGAVGRWRASVGEEGGHLSAQQQRLRGFGPRLLGGSVGSTRHASAHRGRLQLLGAVQRGCRDDDHRGPGPAVTAQDSWGGAGAIPSGADTY